MKIPEKGKNKKERVKKKLKTKPKKDQVLIVAQEIKFARLLSGNEKKTRDRVLKSLKKWLLNCFDKGYAFKEDDFVRVWKGLFYAVWMSDKPLIQEELCETISGVLDIFPVGHLKHALLMYKAGLRVLASEWYGIDHHRMDKFLMLVRRYLRASLRCLSRSDWSEDACRMYAKTMSGTDGILSPRAPHYARNATSMILHVIDCYLEEIAKVSNGDIPESSLVQLLRPFCEYMSKGESTTVCAAARRLFTALMRQSEVGIKYQHATQAWKEMGCPEGGPEALELVSDDEDDEGQENGEEYSDGEDNSGPLDPRAGRVDVTLPLLPVPAASLASLLHQLLPTTASKAQKRLKICHERLVQLSRSQYPLATPVSPAQSVTTPALKPTRCAAALTQLEAELIAHSDELALRGLSRKHRKRLLARARAGLSIVEELSTEQEPAAKSAKNGDWQVEPAQPKQAKTDTSNKENNNKKRKNNVNNVSDNKKRKTIANSDVTAKTKSNTDIKHIANNVKDSNILVNGKPKTEKLKNKVEKVTKDKTKQNGIAKDKSLKDKAVKKKFEKPLTANSKKTEKVLQKKTENVLLKKTESVLQKKKSDAKETPKNPSLVVNKIKSFQKQTKKINKAEKKQLDTPKRVKFVLKNNCMQGPVDYYKSVRQSPSIPFEPNKQPSKTNLKPSAPSPINPFFKKKMKLAFG